MFAYDEEKKEYLAVVNVGEEYSENSPLKITLYYSKFLTPPIGCVKYVFHFSQPEKTTERAIIPCIQKNAQNSAKITKTSLCFFENLLK